MDTSPASVAAVITTVVFLLVMSFVPDWGVGSASSGTDQAVSQRHSHDTRMFAPRCVAIEQLEEDLTSNRFFLAIANSRRVLGQTVSSPGTLNLKLLCDTNEDDVLSYLRVLQRIDPVLLLLTTRTNDGVFDTPIWLHWVRAKRGEMGDTAFPCGGQLVLDIQVMRRYAGCAAARYGDKHRNEYV
jgi:hypothetical protein